MIMCVYGYSQQNLRLLAPRSNIEVTEEYLELTYTQELPTLKILKATITNGAQKEEISKEFSGTVDLLNFVSRAGWTFVDFLNIKEEKNVKVVTILLKRTTTDGHGKFEQR